MSYSVSSCLSGCVDNSVVLVSTFSLIWEMYGVYSNCKNQESKRGALTMDGRDGSHREHNVSTNDLLSELGKGAFSQCGGDKYRRKR